MIIYINKILALGQFLKIRYGLNMDNDVTFVIIKAHYKNVHLWNLEMPFLVHSSLQLPKINTKLLVQTHITSVFKKKFK
jgi:hypothetical protein